MQRDRKAVARLLKCGPCAFALPQHATLEIVDRPQAIAVPGAAPHSMGLLEWQGRRIPLIDAAMLLADAAARSAAPRYALVVAMQSAPGRPIEYGAIALDTLPDSVEVDDGAWCALAPQWEAFAISCFTHETAPVPVVDPARLFAGAG